MMPEELDDMIEVSCEPFTQVLSIFRLKTKQVKIRSLTLWDPNAEEYMTPLRHCSYKNGMLKGFADIRTRIISKPSEETHSYANNLGTVLTINVLKHIQNTFRILQNVYLSLRPNSIIFYVWK
ncbi:hypothetical protein I4U23_004299 [Adineta vaga]|nr:hypothetical protein I4U23_004299 [Adineta vaga]